MSDTPLRCNCRRNAVTGLRCSRCNAPICPDCSGSAAVGFMCRPCLRGNQSPLYQVSAGTLALGYAVCLPAAAFGGWLLTSILGGFGFFGLMIAFFYGVGIGELALRTTGRKRGLKVEILAGMSAAWGILAGLGMVYMSRQAMISGVNLPPHAHLPAGYLLLPFLNPFLYVDLIIGVVSAVNRVKNL